MKKEIGLWCFAGFCLTTLAGTLLHFLYEWTGENRFVALFSGVNESTWEHIKLLFFPLFFFALIQRRFFKDEPAFWCIKAVGTLVGMALIPTLFYTLRGIFGTTPDWVNISIFYISAAIVFLLENALFSRGRLPCKAPLLPFLLLCGIAVLFFAFTFVPPLLPLFEDPLTGTRGIAP